MKYLIIFFLVLGVTIRVFGSEEMLLCYLGLILLGNVVLVIVTNDKYMASLEDWNDPIIIIGNHPKSGQRVVFDEELSDVCCFVKHQNVNREKDRILALMEKAGNPFVGDHLGKGDHLPILMIRYQYGENRAEDWEDYNARCLAEVKEALKKWHKKLSRKPDWYDKEVAGQVE